MRLTMKAGKSSDVAVVLPSFSANCLAALKVSSSVARPRISSTSCITGTGFMKWMPMNFDGRSVAARRRALLHDLLLDLFLLGRGLDDDVAILEGFVFQRDADPLQRVVAVALGD